MPQFDILTYDLSSPLDLASPNTNNINRTFEKISKPQLLFSDTSQQNAQLVQAPRSQNEQEMKEQIQQAYNSIIAFNALSFKNSMDYIESNFKSCDFYNDESQQMYINTLSQFDLMLQKIKQEPVISWDIHVNTYRSFLGFVCFLEISTSTCDYIVDCLSLRGEISRLNAIFQSPSILKITLDVSSKLSWLHRDFGILNIVNSVNMSVFLKELSMPSVISYLSNNLLRFDFSKINQTFDFRKRPVSLAEIRYMRSFSYLPLRILAAVVSNIKQLPNIQRLFETSQRTSCLQLSQALSHDLLATHIRMFPAEQANSKNHYVLRKILKWRIYRAELEDENVEFIFPAALIAKFIKNYPKDHGEILRELMNQQIEVSLDYAQTVFSFFDSTYFLRHQEKQRQKQQASIAPQMNRSNISNPYAANPQSSSGYACSPPMSPNTLLKSIGWVVDNNQQEGTPEKHYKALISSQNLPSSILTYSPQNGVDSPKHDAVMKEVLNVLNDRCSNQSMTRFHAAVQKDTTDKQRKDSSNEEASEEEEVRFHANLMNKLHSDSNVEMTADYRSKKENNLPQNIADIFELANRKRKGNKDKKRKREEKSPTPKKEAVKEKEKLNIDKLLKEINWI